VFARSANDELGNCHNAISAAAERERRAAAFFCLHGVVGAQPRLQSLCFVCSVRELDFLAAGVLNGMQPYTLMKNPVVESKQYNLLILLVFPSNLSVRASAFL